jgi:hypothetical protein
MPAAPTNVDHLTLGWLDMEIAKGTNGGDDVTRLEAENVTRACTWRAVLARRRGRDPYVEAKLALGLVVGQGVVIAAASFWIVRDQIKEVMTLPNRGKGFGDIEIAKPDGVVGRNVELKVVAGGKRDLFFGVDRLEDQLFDERGNVTVTNDP